MPKFKDPKTGQIVNVNSFLVFLSSLLFGLFFFLYVGETQHALVILGFSILIVISSLINPFPLLFAPIFSLIYSFIAPKIVKDKWLKKGYVKIEDDNDIRRIEEIIQASEESIRGKTIIINLCSNLITSAIYWSLFITVFVAIEYSNGYFDRAEITTWFASIITTTILCAVIITILNILDAFIILYLPLPVNKFTKHILTYCFVACFTLIIFFIPFVLTNKFIKEFIENYFTRVRMSNKLLASTSEVEDIKEIENNKNQEIIIEAVKLAIEIQKYAPSIFTKDSDKEVLIYNGRTYYFRIEQLYSHNASYIGNKVLISRNDYTINDGRLLKVDITNNFELIQVYYSDIFEGNIVIMRKLLESYKDDEVQLNKSP